MVSMARTISAPAMAAPWMAFRPTPPQPNTATADPGSTRAVLNTAPTPVVTRAAHQRGAVERNLRVDLHHVVDRQRGVLGHHAAAREDVERLAVLVLDARRAFGRRGERLALLHAQHRPPARAIAALAAHVDEGRDDMVAHRQSCSPPRPPRPLRPRPRGRAPAAAAAGWCRWWPKDRSGTRRRRRASPSPRLAWGCPRKSFRRPPACSVRGRPPPCHCAPSASPENWGSPRSITAEFQGKAVSVHEESDSREPRKNAGYTSNKRGLLGFLFKQSCDRD